MPTRVEDWYHAVQKDEVRLVAGCSGLDKAVQRVHVVEKPEFANYLEGSEIIFITGVALSAPEELTEIIKGCHASGIVAAVVNLGNYIRALPDEVVSFCNRVGLPLFTVPWHIHIEVLMQKVFQMTAEESSHQAELEQLIGTAIQFPSRQELYVSGLKRMGFEPEWRYCVALVYLEPRKTGADDAWLSSAALLVRERLNGQGHQGFAFLYNQMLVLLVANRLPEEVEELTRGLTEEIVRQFKPTGGIFFSVGRCTKSVRCIQKSYALAEKILTLQLRGQLPEDLHTYGNLGVYKVVIGLEGQDVLAELHDEYLEPLLVYDKTCGTDYVAFVRNFLKYDGRVRDISEKMFIHRNTVHYKIKKVEEILDCDLQRTDTKMYLLIAIMSLRIRPGN